jgi:FMN-dependent NADH-azoreductase
MSKQHRVLVVQSSPSGERSSSRRVAQAIADHRLAAEPDLSLLVRDLSANPPPHWSGAHIGAAYTPPAGRSAEQVHLLAESDVLVQEVMQAEELIISAPMWNFGIPSVLKTWIDHVSRVGVTFRYEGGRPVGLVKNLKQVTVVVSSGGVYSEGPMNAWDHAGPQLEAAFRFLGAERVELIRVEGTAIDAEKAIEAAFTAYRSKARR